DIDACRPRGLEIWPLFGDRERAVKYVAEGEVPVRARREEIPDAGADVEPPRPTQDVVVGNPPFHLTAVGAVRAPANVRFAQRRLDDLNLDVLDAIAGRRQDARKPEEIRLVETPLALQHVVAAIRLSWTQQ